MQIITRHRSPNHSERKRPIKGLIVHATAGSLTSALGWLCNPESRVSAHYVIAKSGTVYELVPESLVAWHAGRSAWRGETDLNEMTSSIELENANTGRDPYPAAQMTACIGLSQQILQRHRIGPAWVIRHLDCAIPRGRKSDPAGFDWAGFRVALFGPTLPVAAGDLYRARCRLWVRREPKREGPFTVVEAGAVVGVLEVVDGDYHRNTWGQGNQWGRTTAGYIWMPQLEAI